MIYYLFLTSSDTYFCYTRLHRNGQTQMEIDMRQVLDYSSLLIIVRILLLFFIYRTVFFRTLAFLLKDNVLYLRMHLLHYMRLVQALLFLNYQKITELEKSNRSLRVKNCSSSSFMFGNMVFTSWR